MSAVCHCTMVYSSWCHIKYPIGLSHYVNHFYDKLNYDYSHKFIASHTYSLVFSTYSLVFSFRQASLQDDDYEAGQEGGI